MPQFRVELELFRGPVDLLLYLVRQDELDATEIALAAVTEQYLAYIAVLDQIDVNSVGDFLDMASLLIEMKSRMVLPGEDEVQEELEDPRQELVRRLLEYKQYRDAASMLEERSRDTAKPLRFMNVSGFTNTEPPGCFATSASSRSRSTSARSSPCARRRTTRPRTSSASSTASSRRNTTNARRSSTR